MRSVRWLVLGITVGAGSVAGCNPASNAGPAFTAADSTAVAATIEKYRTTVLAQDFDAWATTIAENAVVYPPNAKPLNGRAASVAFVKTYPPITKFAITMHELWGHGDVAYSRGTFAIELKLPDGATPSDTGSFSNIMRRQADGSWLHDRVMWNSSLPAPPPPPATPRR